MYRKNTAGQFVGFQLNKTADGTGLTSATVSVRRCIDGTFAAGGGTVTEDTGGGSSAGAYKYAMSQADTNGNDITFWFTATSAIAVGVNIITTAADPTNATTLGLTNLDATVSSRLASASLLSASGTASAGGASTLTLAGAVATDSLYTGQVVVVTGGTGAGQARVITSYVGSTKVATVDRAWLTQPDNTSTFVVLALDAPKIDSSLRSTDINSANLDAAISTRMATFSLPTNFSSLAIDASGRVNAFLIGILTSVFTEGATGRIAAAFKQFFNIATPAATMDHLVLLDTVTTLTNAPSDSSGVTTLLGRVTAARAAMLDALSLRTGTAAGGAAGSITLDAGASATNDLYKGQWVVITSGAGAGQARLITGYTGSTQVATVHRNWATNPDNTSVFYLLSAADIQGVVLADTITTYTGDTPQTGDSYARIGAAGAGLTALGDTRVAHLDADVSSRTKPADTQAAVTTVTNLTNAPTAGDFTATMKTSLNAATPAVTVSDKTGFSLSAAGIQAIWDALTSALTTAGSIGKRIVDYLTGDSYARLGAPAGASIAADIAEIEAETDAIGSPAGASLAADIASIKTDTGTSIPGRLPAALVGGRIDASVGAMASDVMTDAAFAAGTGKKVVRASTAQSGAASTITLDGAASATDSLYTGQTVYLTGGVGAGQSRVITGYVGSTKVATVDRAWQTNPDGTSTFAILPSDAPKTDSSLQVVAASVQGNVTGSVASVTAGVTVATNNDKTGYALTAGEHTSIASDAQTGLTAQGYTTTRAGYLDTLNGLVQAIWDKATSALTVVGSIGKLLVTNIDAAISSRLASGSYSAPLDAAGTRSAVGLASANLDTQLAEIEGETDDIATVKAKTDNLPASPAATGDAMALTSGERTTLAGVIWASATRTLTSFGTLIADIWAAVADSTGVTTLLARLTSGRAANLDNVDATVSSRLATSGYTAPDNTSITAIKAKTDNLPEGIKKNTALAAFEFFMADASDHVTGKTGLTVTAQRSIDGGAFAACTNTPTEVSNGLYAINLSAADVNGTVVTLRFSASGADATLITVKTAA